MNIEKTEVWITCERPVEADVVIEFVEIESYGVYGIGSVFNSKNSLTLNSQTLDEQAGVSWT